MSSGHYEEHLQNEVARLTAELAAEREQLAKTLALQHETLIASIDKTAMLAKLREALFETLEVAMRHEQGYYIDRARAVLTETANGD